MNNKSTNKPDTVVKAKKVGEGRYDIYEDHKVVYQSVVAKSEEEAIDLYTYSRDFLNHQPIDSPGFP